jgi:hypothetical protein
MVHKMQARHQDTKGKQVQSTSQCTWWQAKIWHQLLWDICTSCHLVLHSTPIGSFHPQQVVHKTSWRHTCISSGRHWIWYVYGST